MGARLRGAAASIKRTERPEQRSSVCLSRFQARQTSLESSLTYSSV